MGSRYEVEVIITSAKDLKNVSWKHGPLKPYAVVWVDPQAKCSTRVDEEGDTCPYWDEKLVIPFNSPIEDSTLYIDIVHANAAEDTKPLIGSAKLSLRDVVDDVGLGERAERKLDLKRPSGRPQGKLDVNVNVREPRHQARSAYPAPYGVPPPAYGAPTPAYGAPPPPYNYNTNYAAPPSGYPYNAPPSYGQPSYGQPAYGHEYKEEKKSKFGGMGTGLAVGAAAGLLGGLAIAEGVDYVEDQVAEEAAEKVEEDLGYDGDDF